jgi:hypothetical protein
MAASPLPPRAPKGKWEKAFDWSYWWFLLAGPVIPNLIPGLTFWQRVVVGIAVMTAVTVFLFRCRQRDRRARLASDADKLGLIECCLRYPQAAPGSLREPWTLGMAQLEKRRIIFTPLLEEDGLQTGTAHKLAVHEFLGSRTTAGTTGRETLTLLTGSETVRRLCLLNTRLTPGVC